MRLLLTCTELGLGHVNRIIPLGKKLQKRGHELYFISGGVAYQLLKKEFENVYSCTPISWYESPRGIMPSISLLNILLPLPWYDCKHRKLKLKASNSKETVRRYYDLRKHVPKLRPDLVISDGDMISLRLGNKWKIPSIYITNIIRPTYRFPALLTPGERFTERYVKKCAKIIVPDTQKYTICEYNLGNLDELGIREKVEFVGTFSDMHACKYEGGSEKHIFASISGPTGTKAKLARTIIPVLSSLESKSIVSLGEPDNKNTKRLSNCEVHGWLNKNQRREFMKNAKIVIFSGGHGTCYEVIKHKKPSICMPTQPEQMGNARKLDELSCSIYVENKRQIKLAIEKIEGNIEFYKNNVQRLSEYSSRFNGLDGAVTVVENTLQS